MLIPKKEYSWTYDVLRLLAQLTDVLDGAMRFVVVTDKDTITTCEKKDEIKVR